MSGRGCCRSREWRCNGGFDNMLNEDNGGAKATQQSFELVTADLVSRHGATVVGLDVCENGAGMVLSA